MNPFIVRAKIVRDDLIDDEHVTEGLRDDLCDRDTVRNLGHALYDSNTNVSRNAIDFFIAAIAPGMSFHLDSRIILKCLQGAFEIRYSILRPSPYLDVH
jgi:hypothetical protein